MSILEVAAQAFIKKSGSSGLDTNSVISALKNLLPSSGGSIDLAALVEKFGSSGLSSVVGSWLGDGDNALIGASDITNAFGAEKISSFSNELGIDPGTASAGLANILPSLLNHNSSGGALMGSPGDIGGVLDIAKKLF